MSNHNDGKWHGWHGEDMRPASVHEKSVIEYVWHDQNINTAGKTTRKAGIDDKDASPAWSHILKFRVVKEHKDPVVTEYKGACWAYHYTSTEPKTASHNVGGNCIHGIWNATHVDGKLQSFTWKAT